LRVHRPGLGSSRLATSYETTAAERGPLLISIHPSTWLAGPLAIATHIVGSTQNTFRTRIPQQRERCTRTCGAARCAARHAFEPCALSAASPPRKTRPAKGKRPKSSVAHVRRLIDWAWARHRPLGHAAERFGFQFLATRGRKQPGSLASCGRLPMTRMDHGPWAKLANAGWESTGGHGLITSSSMFRQRRTGAIVRANPLLASIVLYSSGRST